ncbi:hypothetical protein RI367_002758 [Sorochytrium milnesiophthora]
MESVKGTLRHNEGLRSSLSGGAAGAAASFLTCPLDVVKTRLQSSGSAQSRYRGTVHALITIWKEEGYRGWYRGLAPTMLGYLPSWALYFLVYDDLKRELGELVDSRDIGWAKGAPINIASAMGAGAVSTTATNPLWVVKTRFMTQGPNTSYHYSSISDSFVKIYQKEGIAGFYKGLGTSLLGVSHAAVHFPTYEKLKLIMGNFETTGKLSLRANADSSTPQRLSTASLLVASCISKMIASMITYPHEVLRTRLQNQTDEVRYKSLRHCIRVMYREEGMRGFYRGLGTNLLRTVPNSAITLFTYERLSAALANWCGQEHTSRDGHPH